MGPKLITSVVTFALLLGVECLGHSLECRANLEAFTEAHNLRLSTAAYMKNVDPSRLCPLQITTIHHLESPTDICAIVGNIHIILRDIISKLPKLEGTIFVGQNEYQAARELLQENLYNLEATISSLISQQTNDDHLDTKNAIQVHYRCFSSVVQARLMEADDLQELYERERMLRVVALIQPTRLGEAEVLFSQLNNNSLIDEIMDELHSYNLDTYREGMMAFTTILHTVSLRVEAFLKWHDLLLHNDEHMENGIIILKQLVDAEVNGNPPPEDKDRLEEIKATIDRYHHARILFWVRDIENDNIQPVIDYVSPNRLHMVGYTFRTSIPELVEETMRKPANFAQLVKFMQGLRWNIHKYLALNELWSRTTTTEQRLIVAYNVKQTMSSLNGPDPSDEVLAQFDAMKARMPLAIRTLIWHKECRIQSKWLGHFLIPSNSSLFDINNRQVSSTVQENLPEEGLTSWFEIVPQVTRDTISFNLMNYGYAQHYLEEHIDWNAKRRWASFKASQPGYQWNFEFDDETSLDTRILNTQTPGYLMPDSRIEVFRFVYILRLPDMQPNQHTWTLICVE